MKDEIAEFKELVQAVKSGTAASMEEASASSMMIDELPTVSHGVLPAWMVKSRPEAGD